MTNLQRLARRLRGAEEADILTALQKLLKAEQARSRRVTNALSIHLYAAGEALRRYGCHLATCRWHRSGKACDCGLTRALGRREV